MSKAMMGIGNVIFWVAAASCDSESLVIPAIMLVLGGTMMLTGMSMEKKND